MGTMESLAANDSNDWPPCALGPLRYAGQIFANVLGRVGDMEELWNKILG